MIDVLIEMLHTNNSFLIVLSGLVIGLLHSFEPDHISAVSTQLSNSNLYKSKKFSFKSLTINSSIRGMMWGMGHTSSIIVLGLLIAGLSLKISDSFFAGVEFIVGLMLVGLGVLTATNKSIVKQKHIHPHEHTNGTIHTHFHDHGVNHRHGHKSYLIGCIQGVAGSGSLVALTASATNDFNMMISFLALFGVGSIIGMTLASGILGLPFVLLPKIRLAQKYFRYVISGIALLVGINIILTVGLDASLFLLH